LLARGAQVNWSNPDGVTPLHLAAYNLQPAVAALLIQKGATIDARTVDGGWTPLYKVIVRLAMRRPRADQPPPHIVARAIQVTELLLANGADVNARDAKNARPIHYAVMTEQRGLLRLLIEKGADVNARDADGASPLYQAATRDAVEMAELLIAAGADVNVGGATMYNPLGSAVAHGNSGVVRLLLAHGADLTVVYEDGATPLNVACRSLIGAYTVRGPTPGARAERRRYPAAQIGYERRLLEQDTAEFGPVAAMLMERGADPNVGRWDLKPLLAAALVGDRRLAEAALAHGAQIDPAPAPGTESPLLAAIGEGHTDVAEMLIEKGAQVNARTARLNRNALHALAAHMPDARLAELLIRKGVDVNALDADGRTPLAVAVKEGHDQVAEVIRRHGGR